MGRATDLLAFLHWPGKVDDFPGQHLTLTWPLCQERRAYQQEQRPDLYAQTARHQGRAHGGRGGYEP